MFDQVAAQAVAASYQSTSSTRQLCNVNDDADNDASEDEDGNTMEATMDHATACRGKYVSLLGLFIVWTPMLIVG